MVQRRLRAQGPKGLEAEFDCLNDLRTDGMGWAVFMPAGEPGRWKQASRRGELHGKLRRYAPGHLSHLRQELAVLQDSVDAWGTMGVHQDCIADCIAGVSIGFHVRRLMERHGDAAACEAGEVLASLAEPC